LKNNIPLKIHSSAIYYQGQSRKTDKLFRGWVHCWLWISK